MLKDIHISEVLAQMEIPAQGGKQNVFSVSFVRDNKTKSGDRGSIKKVNQAIKGPRPFISTSPKSIASGGKKWLHKDKNTIPLIDMETGDPCTPKFTHLLTFNGKKIRHYGSE